MQALAFYHDTAARLRDAGGEDRAGGAIGERVMGDAGFFTITSPVGLLGLAVLCPTRLRCLGAEANPGLAEQKAARR